MPAQQYALNSQFAPQHVSSPKVEFSLKSCARNIYIDCYHHRYSSFLFFFLTTNSYQAQRNLCNAVPGFHCQNWQQRQTRSAIFSSCKFRSFLQDMELLTLMVKTNNELLFNSKTTFLLTSFFRPGNRITPKATQLL